MKQIISASYKDDTPAFFSEEFFKNYRKGATTVYTKYGPKTVSLKPEDVHCIVFWTKNCSDHFIEHMTDLKVPFYIQWTITGYDKDMEPEVPEKPEVMERFRKVSQMLGKDRVVWRYDPILMSDKYDVTFHIHKFSAMARRLKGYTTRCVISFFDEYNKLTSEIARGTMRKPTDDEVAKMAAAIGAIARMNGITVQTCAERGYDLTPYGIKEGPCVDADYIEKRFGIKLEPEIKQKNSFRRCECAQNTDIGSYHRCRHDCKYCYAK